MIEHHPAPVIEHKAPVITEPMKKTEPLPKPMPKTTKQVDAPAQIVVNLPASATLIVDGYTTRATTARRSFASPVLKAGKVYSYTLKAQHNGEVKTEKILVTAGKQAVVNFDFSKNVAAR